MSVEFKELDQGRVVEVKISGKLAGEDYRLLAPEFERLCEQHDKVSLLVELQDFHGWHAGALWEDIKLDLKHFNDIDRLAIVGETTWQKGMASFCKPFTTAQIKYFGPAQRDEALAWVREAAVGSA
jgi:hypothetical protein